MRQQHLLLLLSGYLEVPLVLRVEQHRDLADLTIKTILFHLQYPVILHVVFLKDHYGVSLLRYLGGTEDRPNRQVVVILDFLWMDDHTYMDVMV